jgi:hypothetical protein
MPSNDSTYEYLNVSETEQKKLPDFAIPTQLCDGNFRFILLRSRGKEAIETGWNKDKNYTFEDPKLLRHIEGGGNYGVIPTSGGMCILDADEYDTLHKIGALSVFDNTFMVRTGSDQERYHYYVKCEGLEHGKKIPFYDLLHPKQHLGEIYCEGCSAYVVGPGCKHPSGNTYLVLKDEPIRTFSETDISNEFFSRVKSRLTLKDDGHHQLATKIPGAFKPHMDLLTDQLGLRIENFAMPINAIKHGDEMQGAHPVHGSTHGQNFSINTRNNVWFCYRDWCGGDPISWIAVQEGLIECHEVETTPIEGELFIKVKELLANKYGYANQIRDLERKYNNRETPGKPIDETAYEELEARCKAGNYLRFTSKLPRTNFISKYVECMSQTSDAYPEYNYAASMMILSTLTNRKAVIRMQQGDIYPNLWIFCLGGSTTSRKTTVMNRAKDFLYDVTAYNQLPTSFSPEGLIEELAELPHAWLIKDEAGSLLASLQKSYMADMRDLFCELFECKDYRRTLRKSNKKGASTDFMIKNPYITQLYATTPNNFKEYTTMIDLTSGWLLRFLFFYPRHWKQNKPFTPMNNDMLEKMGKLKDQIEKLYSVFSREEEIEFVLSDEALMHFQEWQEMNENVINNERNRDMIRDALFGRLISYALKLATVFTIGSDAFMRRMSLCSYSPNSGASITIGLPEIEEACRQVDDYFLPMGMSVVREVDKNETMNVQNKVLAILERKGGKSTRKNVLKDLHIRIRDAEDAFDALVQSGEIDIYDVQGDSGKATKWVTLVRS